MIVATVYLCSFYVTPPDRMAGKADAAGKPPQTEQEKRVAEAREKIRASRDRERQDREQGKDRGR